MNWLIIATIILVSLIAGSTLMLLYLRPHLKATQKLDEETMQQNEELIWANQALTETKVRLEDEAKQLQAENDKLLLQKDSATQQIETLNNSIAVIQKQAEEAATLFYESQMKIAQENFERSLELEAQNYQANVEGFQNQYNETVAGMMEQYKTLGENVAQMRATNDAAVAAAKRAEAMKTQQDFYRIQLSDTDIHEIELLRQVEPYLRDKEPLNKVIWKCYYEKPTTDMIGRVVGGGIHTGIYKITEIATGKCYVGQAANIADRWKQHIKRGVGAEAPTRNKLYPAMIAAGPENFTFEVIEECTRALLDEREKYWTDYFKAQEFGFSIRRG